MESFGIETQFGLVDFNKWWWWDYCFCFRIVIETESPCLLLLVIGFRLSLYREQAFNFTFFVGCLRVEDVRGSKLMSYYGTTFRKRQRIQRHQSLCLSLHRWEEVVTEEKAKTCEYMWQKKPRHVNTCDRRSANFMHTCDFAGGANMWQQKRQEHVIEEVVYSL